MERRMQKLASHNADYRFGELSVYAENRNIQSMPNIQLYPLTILRRGKPAGPGMTVTALRIQEMSACSKERSGTHTPHAAHTKNKTEKGRRGIDGQTKGRGIMKIVETAKYQGLAATHNYTTGHGVFDSQ